MGWVIPNLSHLWPADALAADRTISVEYLAWVSGYAGLFVLAFLSLSVAIFQRKEVC